MGSSQGGLLPRRARQQKVQGYARPRRESGAISPRTLRYVGYLSRRARGKGTRDGTRYGTSRLAPRTFFRHHVLHISMAAAIGDVQGLHKAVLNHKTRLCNGKGAPARADEPEA